MRLLPLAGAVCAALIAGSATATVTLKPLDRRINDASLDSIQELDGTRPFVKTTNGEPTIAEYGLALVSVFNTVGAQVAANEQGQPYLERNLRLAYSHSQDGGRTWRSDYLPPLPGSTTTLGYGMVANDRLGRFYASGLGRDANGRITVTVNRSVDGGRNFAAAVPVDSAGRADRPWLAVGPAVGKTSARFRDNVYLSWVSFDDSVGSSVLRFARSTDGGATFTTKTVFAPPPDPNQNNPQNVVQFPTVAVDAYNGRIYVAFLQFGFVSSDYLRIMTSDDGGETFRPLAFNRPGSPSPEVLPSVQPGTYTECSATRFEQPGSPPLFFGNTVLTLHSGPNLGGSASGYPRYANATRVNMQPMLAVSKDVIHMVWAASTSDDFGAATSGANVLYMRSDNNGVTWSEPKAINANAGGSNRSVTPAIAIGSFAGETALPLLPSTNNVHITYYTQEPDGTLSFNLAQSSDRGRSFPDSKKRRLNSNPIELAPSSVPMPTEANPYQMTHYDRLVTPCSSLGEYTGLSVGPGVLHAVWGDSSATMQQPVHPLDPISGQTHAKENVHFTTQLAF
ncbi:sialidase family protein [Dokdonella sp.]|uniref:sialidase family protein n=1 Tax=Dokdonella sp. TaxID=2291710 RepID=UPI001B17054C|nr:sialidase family protein [Dokdonella sp.]MBO9662856.1 exo-alpha-sialidase [Dokdonella sp.]